MGFRKRLGGSIGLHRRLIIVVIVALIVIFAAGQVIPQKRDISFAELMELRDQRPVLISILDAAGALDIYTSPVTLGLLAILAVLAVVWFGLRIKAFISEAGESLFTEKAAERAIDAEAQCPEDFTAADVAGLDVGYKIDVEGNRFEAVRFRLGSLGRIAAAVGIAILLSGGLTVFYTRFSAEAILTQGQNFSGVPDEYSELKTPMLDTFPFLNFNVQKVRAIEVGNKPQNSFVRIVHQPMDGFVRTVVGPDEWTDIGGVSMRLEEIGVSPLLVLKGPGGQTYEQAYVSLMVSYGDEDGYKFPATQYTATFVFYPDYVRSNFEDRTRSLKLRNPVFGVKISRGGKIIAEKLMTVGDSMEFEGFMLQIPSLQLWGKLAFRTHRGESFVLAGFAVLAAGLLSGMFFYRRRVRGDVIGGVAKLTAWGGSAASANRRIMAVFVEAIEKGKISGA